jgi:low temperature requirement protein LtrA
VALPELLDGVGGPAGDIVELGDHRGCGHGVSPVRPAALPAGAARQPVGVLGLAEGRAGAGHEVGLPHLGAEVVGARVGDDMARVAPRGQSVAEELVHPEPRADHADYRAVTLGYFIMRAALVVQWLRAGAEDPARRRTALRYATGISVLQAGWILRLVLAETGALAAWAEVPSFVLLAVLELLVPRWAERARATTWHPHHIAERYGLFTIILFGESVLAASSGVEGALAAAEPSGPLVVIAGCGLIMLFALWWLYFLTPAGEGLSDRRHRSYLWGYGHYGIFAALAALGAGLEVAVEQTGHDLKAAPLAICYAVAVPAAAFIVLIRLVHAPIAAEPAVRPAVVTCAVTAVLLLPLAAPGTGVAAVIAATAAVCVLMIAVTVAPGSAGKRRSPRTAALAE